VFSGQKPEQSGFRIRPYRTAVGKGLSLLHLLPTKKTALLYLEVYLNFPRHLILAFFVIVFFSSTLCAQEQPASEPDDWKLTRGAHSFEIEAGFAPTQPIFFSGRKEYDTAGRKFGMLSLRYGRIVGTKGPVTYEYLAEVIPVALAFNNEVIDETAPPTSPLATKRETTYAFAFEPISFRFIFRPNKRVKPFLQTGAGFLFAKKPIPIPGSLSYDFIGDFGGGVMYSLSKRKTINFGYRYFHVSNMNIGRINPGYNANVFYVGFSFFNK